MAMTERPRLTALGMNDHSGQDELLVAANRKAEARRRASRALVRASDRRRIIPMAVVGAVVLVGVGIADAGVQSTVPSTTTSTPPATVPAAVTRSQAALAAVEHALAADRRTIAGLQGAAQSAAAAAAAAATKIRTGSPAGSSSPGNAPAAPPSGTTSTPSVPTATLPPLPALPALPSAPATHATTGASSLG